MDEREQRRPGSQRGTAVTREQPRDPRRRPQGARPRQSTAQEQIQARRERLAAREAAASAGEEPAVRRVPDRDGAASAPRRSREPASGQESAAQSRDGEKPRTRSSTRSGSPVKKNRKKKKKTPRIYNTNFGFKFVTMLAVVGVIVLAMMIFFKVRKIQVNQKGTDDPANQVSVNITTDQNLSYYTPEEIIEASGINLDDNLLSLSKAAIASRIHAALPYINEIQIKKKLPDTVIITVSEFTVTYGIQDETGGWWLMSRECRILEPSDEMGVKGHMIVTGMPIQVPEVGDYIKPIATEGADLSEIAAKRSATEMVLPQLERSDFAKQIVSVDVSTSYDIILWYGTQYEIRLGNTENLAYKLQYLQAVLNQLGRDKSGTIDLTFTEDNGAHFLPFG